MKDFNFVKFEGYYPRGDTKIAINKSGLIRLSSGFCRITNEARSKYVVLFYDSVNKAIALKFTNNKENGSFALTRDRDAATISAISFMKANNINTKITAGRYESKKVNNPKIGLIYIIELKTK